MLQAVILCGGSGTRLWPLSRRAFPKQFVSLINGKGLLSLTLERVAPLTDRNLGVMCAGAKEQRFLMREAIAGAEEDQYGRVISINDASKRQAQ